MKFLGKRADSAILAEGLKYHKNRGNSRLRAMLLEEQRGFCAYTEKRVAKPDSVDVEHFDPGRKYQDDYYNYYAVLRDANQRKRKKEAKHRGAAFFESRFFQDAGQLGRRVRFVAEWNVYEETDEADVEAAALIDYLGFNDPEVCEDRRLHVDRLRGLLRDAGWKDGAVDYLREHPEELSFVTAIEARFGLDLGPLLDEIGQSTRL
jgi:hypothetical protein